MWPPEAFGQARVDQICNLLSEIKPSLTAEDDAYVKQIIEAPITKKVK
jgi:hypothetical protein